MRRLRVRPKANRPSPASARLPGSGTETKATELRNKVSPCGTYAARRGRRSAGTGEAVRAARCMPLTS